MNRFGSSENISGKKSEGVRLQNSLGQIENDSFFPIEFYDHFVKLSDQILRCHRMSL